MSKQKTKKDMEEIKPLSENKTVVTEETKEIKPVESDTEVLTEKLKEVIATEESKQPEIKEGEKKRGRPKGSTSNKTDENKQPSIIIPIAPIIDLFVRRMPNPIPLTSTEKEYLNEAGNKLIEKYSDKIDYLEEIQFSILIFGVVYPRLKKPESEENK